jgi:hypothetical protein
LALHPGIFCDFLNHHVCWVSEIEGLRMRKQAGSNQFRMLFLPESPRFLMHKGKAFEAFKVWKRIRGVDTVESREEFFVMKASVEEEEAEVAAGAGEKRFPWLDFFAVPRCRRAIIYANIMILLGQLTGYVTSSTATPFLIQHQPLLYSIQPPPLLNQLRHVFITFVHNQVD